MEENKKPQTDDSNSLETLEGTSEVITPAQDVAAEKLPKKKTSLATKAKDMVSHLNVYLLLFILIIVAGLIIFYVVFNSSQKAEVGIPESQELTQEAIDDLVGSDAKVGDPKQLLTVESDSVFTGKVLIREGLDVAGPIKVGGSLSLPGITVSGQSAFDEVTINTLAIAGDATVQGQLSVQDGLTVSGPVTFSGTFSAAAFAIESLQVNQNLNINRHIDAGGSTPGIVGGSAVGSGGTVTISGTDTAGTITINVGSGSGAGVIATVNFSNAFGGTPHVVITPVATQGSPTISANQAFYLSNRTTTSFSVAYVGTSLSPGSISFDYIVIE
jgi:cytoskeletal protein CcmA (bactofilin family)